LNIRCRRSYSYTSVEPNIYIPSKILDYTDYMKASASRMRIDVHPRCRLRARVQSIDDRTQMPLLPRLCDDVVDSSPTLWRGSSRIIEHNPRVYHRESETAAENSVVRHRRVVERYDRHRALLSERPRLARTKIYSLSSYSIQFCPAQGYAVVM
jgi:hypothetical protein